MALKISIVTPTIRKDGLEIIRKSLKAQSFTEWEWLIGSPFDPEIPEATWVKDDFLGGYWSLNRIYNRLFSLSRGELVVSWQDWVATSPDGLDKFWLAYEKTKGCITGVGDQYETVNKWGRPIVKIWSDPRKTTQYGSFYEAFPDDCEWNWAAVPRKALESIGGMDEMLDMLGYGGDQLSAVRRLDAAGYKFFIDQTNESYTVRHGREDFGGEDKWNASHTLFNGKFLAREQQLKQEGRWPCVGYLKPV